MQNYVTHWGKRYYFDNLYEPMLELSMVKLLQAGESENRRIVEEARIDHIIGKGSAETRHERR